MAPVKTPSPAELAALEHAFASDPASDAYRPLTEAYLALTRFMEAMVVCKKGVKAHPQDPAPHVLLARIFAAQGKARKALEELTAARTLAPDDVTANRMAGLLHLDLGEAEEGRAALERAWKAAPQDPETLAALAARGLVFEAPRPPPPPAAPEPATAPPAAVPAPAADLLAALPPDPGGAAAPPTLPGAQAAQAAAPPAARPAPARNVAYAEELASRYVTREYHLPDGDDHHHDGRAHPARRRSRAAMVTTLSIGGALVAALVVWGVMSSIHQQRVREIALLLRQAGELLEKDTYGSYREAGTLCQRILDKGPNEDDALGAHAYLAYIDAIRWGEHGESERLRDEAKKHLDAVARTGRTHSHAFAAQAYLDFHSGDAKGAIVRLREVIAKQATQSVLLRGVLGILLLESGDLDGSRTELTLARQYAPSDVRITQKLAEGWRRRGQGFELQASTLYDTVLRLSPDHVPSLLGKAELLLDTGKADEAAKHIARVLELGSSTPPNASPRQVAVAHALRGAVLFAQKKDGREEEAQALTLDPGNADIHDLIGRRKLRAGDAAGAAESFQKAIAIEPGRVAFYVDLAGALIQKPGTGPREAVAALEKASASSGNARVTKLLGDAYRADNDLEKARAAYEKALEQDKTFTGARVALARLYRQQKDYTKALDELNTAVKEYGETNVGAAPVDVEIAETEEARGSPPEVVEKAYVAALQADPQSCPALFWLGRSRSARKGRGFDPSLASQMLSAYLRSCPSGPNAGEAQSILATLK